MKPRDYKAEWKKGANIAKSIIGIKGQTRKREERTI